MILSLKNIGKIKEATVEIKGITVIAGENDTGKSTVGKALFATFNSFHDIKTQIKFERIQSVENIMDRIFPNFSESSFWFGDNKEFARKLVEKRDEYIEKSEMLKKDIMYLLVEDNPYYNEDEDAQIINELVERLSAILNVSNEDIFKSVLNKNLNAEFYGQITNIFDSENGKIVLNIKGNDYNISINDSNVSGINLDKNISLLTEVVYLDDPFIIDEPTRIPFIRFPNKSLYLDHRRHLINKIFTRGDVNVVEEIVANKKFDQIYDKLNIVCSGNVIQQKPKKLGYQKDDSSKILELRNLSTGLKTFVIFKKLLTDGVLEQNGIIILDEPEIHLHPEWQLIFAELIVLIQKEFGMHILLNTHSPYFLNAIEVYADKHDLKNKCKYYLAKNDGNISVIDDVTDRIDLIYEKLARPLQDLENMRWSDE